jgi:hypothetical protein
MKKIARSLLATTSMVVLGVALPVGAMAYDNAIAGTNHPVYVYPTPDAPAPQPAAKSTPLPSRPMRAAHL